MEKQPPVQVRLNDENSEAVRRIAKEDFRSVPKLVNHIIAQAVLARAIKSLPSKDKKR